MGLGPPYAPYLPDRVRLRLDVDPDTFCWTWTGATNNRGYGQVHHAGRTELVHRVVYAAFGRVIPPGHVADHACHDPATCEGGTSCPHRRCANPWHIAPATPAQNAARDRATPQGRGATWARTGRCEHGHDVTDPSNVKLSSGQVSCRACANARNAAYRARRRQATA